MTGPYNAGPAAVAVTANAFDATYGVIRTAQATVTVHFVGER